MVLHCGAVHSIEYYDVMAADAQKLVSRAARTLKRLQSQRRTGIAYFDHGAEDGIGILNRLTRGAPDSASLFETIRTGDVAETVIIRRLADRRDPVTGKALPLKHQKRWLIDAEKFAQQVVAHDIQISAPKWVSVIYGLASAPLRAKIASAHHRAVARVLVFIRDNGLVVARSGQDGLRREVVDDALIASYFHRLSRSNDPHLHTHSLLMNICRRADGSVGTVDTKQIVAYGAAMTELYRAELASILTRELGLAIKQEEHGFSLPAVPAEVVELFSKRRIAIEEEAEARGFEPGHDRKPAQKVSYDTRKSKTKGVTAETLRAGWIAEAQQIGFDPATFMPAIEAACAAHIAHDQPTDGLKSLDREDLIGTVFARDAQLSWPDILRRVAQQVQTFASASEALVLAEELRKQLIDLPRHDHGEKIYTTRIVIEAEHTLLKTAVAGRSRWKNLTKSQVSAGLKRYPTLSAEQKAAVIHALNRDRVAVVNGSAGAGKSYMSFAIARIAEDHGLWVIGTSAAWTAAHVLRREAGLTVDATYSLTKLLAELAIGDMVLTEKTVVIVDEAGMAPLAAIADLVGYADKAGAKIVLVGDVKQLQPVAFGAPMRALADELGFAQLVGIRRQRHEWMRAAAVDLAAHRPDSAVDAYDKAGCTAVHIDASTTMAAAADDYVSQAMQDRTATPLLNQLLVTSRNRDVAELNRLIRARLQTAGMLEPDSLKIRALPRGKKEKAEPVDLNLAVGDRIMFGARLEIGSRTIFNSDVARIMSLEPDGKNPRLTFVLDRLDDRGETLLFMARYNDLVSRFSESKVPEIQHAFAQTVHAAQGATVERAIVVDVEGLSAEQTYVSMTRHRDRLSIHLNAEKSLSRRRREVVRLSGHDNMIEGPDLDRRSVTLTKEEREAVIQRCKANARRPQLDRNPSFYIRDMSRWLEASNPVAEFRRQASRPSRPRRASRLEPNQPAIFAMSAPTALSAAEITELDRNEFTSKQVLSALKLTKTKVEKLYHGASGTYVSLSNGRPVWSTYQQEELARRRCVSEHLFVQAAVVLMSRPLRWARAWVRRVFGLKGLNPLASAARRRERQDQEPNERSHATRLPVIDTEPVEQQASSDRRARRFAMWRRIERDEVAHAEVANGSGYSHAIETQGIVAAPHRDDDRLLKHQQNDERQLGETLHSLAYETESFDHDPRMDRRQRRFALWRSMERGSVAPVNTMYAPADGRSGPDLAAELRNPSSDVRPALASLEQPDLIAAMAEQPHNPFAMIWERDDEGHEEAKGRRRRRLSSWSRLAENEDQSREDKQTPAEPVAGDNSGARQSRDVDPGNPAPLAVTETTPPVVDQIRGTSASVPPDKISAISPSPILEVSPPVDDGNATTAHINGISALPRSPRHQNEPPVEQLNKSARKQPASSFDRMMKIVETRKVEYGIDPSRPLKAPAAGLTKVSQINSTSQPQPAIVPKKRPKHPIWKILGIGLNFDGINPRKLTEDEKAGKSVNPTTENSSGSVEKLTGSSQKLASKPGPLPNPNDPKGR